MTQDFFIFFSKHNFFLENTGFPENLGVLNTGKYWDTGFLDIGKYWDIGFIFEHYLLFFEIRFRAILGYWVSI